MIREVSVTDVWYLVLAMRWTILLTLLAFVLLLVLVIERKLRPVEVIR